MRFVGYKVGNKKFGCSQKAREKAEKLAKETGQKVELYSYKV